LAFLFCAQILFAVLLLRRHLERDKGGREGQPSGDM
jgi:hypothetical protein